MLPAACDSKHQGSGILPGLRWSLATATNQRQARGFWPRSWHPSHGNSLAQTPVRGRCRTALPAVVATLAAEAAERIICHLVGAKSVRAAHCLSGQADHGSTSGLLNDRVPTISGSRPRVQGLGFRVWGSGSRFQNLDTRIAQQCRHGIGSPVRGFPHCGSRV